MHFDDRLATVLRQTATGEAIARVQYRQLIDLLGSGAIAPGDPGHDAAYLRLSELNGRIPPADRAAMLRDSGVRLRNPNLVAQLAGDDRDVAAAALDNAALGEDEWLDLLPALPIAARGLLAGNRSRGARVDALLVRLGIRERTLPPPQGAAASGDAAGAAPEALTTAPVQAARTTSRIAGPAPANDTLNDADTAQTGDAIRAIVRRIEEFRRARVAMAEPGIDDSPRLPLGEPQADWHHRITAFDFTTDSQGRIDWADHEMAPMIVGMNLADPDWTENRPALRQLVRHYQPVRGWPVGLGGAPAIAGRWLIDAMPLFEREAGRFTGFCGRMRRIDDPATPAAADRNADTANADAMRQVLHELRNPVAAIQGFAEMTQQGLQGPISHEYRALAATIAGDSARILAAFEEIDRLVKLESGGMALDPGTTDLVATVRQVTAHIAPYLQRRGSGFAFAAAEEHLPVALGGGDAERLVWRLLAALAGMAAPGETLRLKLRRSQDAVRLVMRLPAALAALEDEDIYRAGVTQTQALSAGMFGTGFALRLAASEARAAGGSLQRKHDRLRLTLPGLTGAGSGHSHTASVAG